ncbi:PepSY-associated TM helix domain-containing protein [uncultured Sphingomonas sp.]|uniref:PepSY-associated TM helix domain-containing protein n=1 Tax=uncultured Sphingomonas sp. TaxID=158754 RepID=UPI002636153E|nr:PepSY-associated TM helix domain-containing protein [uncultured Sphingomonas sp.]
MKPSGRPFWIALHRYAGLAMTLFLGVAALTGCVLSFDRPLDAWLNPDLFAPSRPGRADPLTAVAALERMHPELLATYYPVRAEPGRNIAVRVAPRGTMLLAFDEVLLDAGDGHWAGARQSGAGWDRAHLVRGIYELHCNLLAGTIGRWLMGTAAVLWLLSNLVGVYLTWPTRPPIWKSWKRSWQFRRSSPLPRLLLDIHRASGLWLLAPIAVLAFTSAAMSFYGEALMPAIARLSPPRPSPFDRPPIRPAPSAPPDMRAVLRRATDCARARRLGWQPAVYQFEPDRDLAGVRFTATGRETYRGLGPVTYWFDVPTGRFAYEDNPYDDSAGLGVARALYPLHTGQMIGAPGIALDVVLGLATLEQAGTGVYLWLKRRRMRRPARRAPRSVHG